MKTCFKCAQLKPTSEFYVHRRMSDGHLNKCKSCSKKDVANRVAIKRLIPEWVVSERERCRKKQERYRHLGLAKQVTREVKARWEERHPLKIDAHKKAHRAVRSGKLKNPGICQDCLDKTTNLDKHHEDYSRPLDIVWLCKKCHGIRHRKGFQIKAK